MKCWAQILILVALTGCVPVRIKGKTIHVVLGFGIFAVSQTNRVTVVNATSVGLYAGDGRVNIGISKLYSARVPTNANVVLEINGK
jgi:hypothetical protein